MLNNNFLLLKNRSLPIHICFLTQVPHRSQAMCIIHIQNILRECVEKTLAFSLWVKNTQELKVCALYKDMMFPVRPGIKSSSSCYFFPWIPSILTLKKSPVRWTFHTEKSTEVKAEQATLYLKYQHKSN